MKILFLLLSLIAVRSTSAQKKWYSISKNDIVVFSSMAISGTADGFNQAIIHHEFGIDHPFSDYETSWKRKYKDADNDDFRRAYIGSKSWLVWTTDAFHLTRTIDHTFTGVAIVFAAGDLKEYAKKDRWKVLLIKKGIVPMIIRGIFFNAFYDNLGYDR